MTPDYYWLPIAEGGQQLQIEAISGLLGHHLGNVVDYLWRAGRKPGESAFSDIAKVRRWMEMGRTHARACGSGDPLVTSFAREHLKRRRAALREWAQHAPVATDLDRVRVDAIFRVTDIALYPLASVYWDSAGDWIGMLEAGLRAAEQAAVVCDGVSVRVVS